MTLVSFLPQVLFRAPPHSAKRRSRKLHRGTLVRNPDQLPGALNIAEDVHGSIAPATGVTPGIGRGVVERVPARRLGMGCAVTLAPPRVLRRFGLRVSPWGLVLRQRDGASGMLGGSRLPMSCQIVASCLDCSPDLSAQCYLT